MEHALGHALAADEQVIIQVVASGLPPAEPGKIEPPPTTDSLPDRCNVYEGLTDEEIAEVERIALERSEMTRTFE